MDSRYEKEIEELLNGLGDMTPKETPLQKFARGLNNRLWSLWQTIKSLPTSLPADQLMITAIICIVAAYFLRFVLPGAARFVGIVGVLLFLGAFVFSFRQVFGGGNRDIRWRGHRIDMSSGQQSMIERFTQWLRRQFRS